MSYISIVEPILFIGSFSYAFSYYKKEGRFLSIISLENKYV